MQYFRYHDNLINETQSSVKLWLLIYMVSVTVIYLVPYYTVSFICIVYVAIICMVP